MIKRTRNLSLEQRIMNKIQVDNNTGCWHFTGAKNNVGFGMIRKSQEEGMMTAHKAMYELYNHCIVPADLCVMHTCNCYDCVNPKHLDMGTRKNLVEKMVVSGTHNFFGGTSRKGLTQPTTECPHCSRSIANNVYDRYHGDNCINKPKHK